MVRTTTSAVAVILGSNGYNYDGTTSLDPFIEAATALVDRVEVCAVARERSLTAIELELVERWLAAHFYTMMDNTYQSRSTSGASGSFRGQTAMSLDASLYGQMAKSLDPSGCLIALTTPGGRACAFWLGKRESEQIPYDQRD